jgi:hypothetical protein
MTARSVIVCEGVHDCAGLNAIAQRLERDQGVPPPAAYGIRLVDAGGVDEVPRLCALARSLGFRAIAALDYDTDQKEAAKRLKAGETNADAVVRLPYQHAIEHALIDGLDAPTLVPILEILHATHGFQIPAGLSAMSDAQVREYAANHLKDVGGLHVQLIEELPKGILPMLAKTLLGTIIELGRGRKSGTIQL